MPKTLITGGAGFIGSHLVRHLAGQPDSHVLVVDKLTYAGNLDSLADVHHRPGFTFRQQDIADAPALRELFASFQPDAVVNLAAESHVDRSIDGPQPFIHTNVVGTYTLLQAARAYWERLPDGRRAAFRFLHVSTDEVYGSLGPGDPPFSEHSPYAPRSPYSASKAAGDHLVRAWHVTYGLPVIVTNCSNNYGPYQYPEKLIPLTILTALRGEPIPVFGNGENIRDWIHVQDHVEALECVLRQGSIGRTYTIGGGNERRNIDVVRQITTAMDELFPCGQNPQLNPGPPGHDRLSSYAQLITFVADRPGHDFRQAIDTTTIRGELGWSPRQDFSKGLRATVQWYLENRDWWQPILSRSQPLQRQGILAHGGSR